MLGNLNLQLKTGAAKIRTDLHLRLLSILFILYLSFIALSPLLMATSSKASDLSIPNILNAINKERIQRNLLSLNENSMLSKAAQVKATDMIVRHYFSHINPEGEYIWPTIVAQGYYPYAQLGENLAIEFYDTESLVTAWMNSPTHRANVLNDGFKDQGMGVDFGDTQNNQYHSDIVNTFGTLIISKTVKSAEVKQPETTTKTTSPIAANSPTQTSKTPAAEVKIDQPKTQEKLPDIQVPSNSQKQEPTNLSVSVPLALRGEDNQQSFTLSQQQQTQSSTPANLENTTTQATETPVIGTNSAGFNFREINRMAVIILALLLIIALSYDLISKIQIASLDKKINNLVALILALIVVAFMYWL